MEKADSETILPLHDKDFLNDVSALFSKSESDLIYLLHDLEKNKIKFYNYENAKKLKIDKENSFILLKSFLFIVYCIKKFNNKRIIEELISIGIPSKKIELFVSEVLTLSPDSANVIENILTVEEEVSSFSHIYSITFDHYYKFIKFDTQNVMVPFMNLHLVTHSRTPDDKQKLNISLDINQLRFLMSSLEDFYKRMQEENKETEQLMNNKIDLVWGA